MYYMYTTINNHRYVRNQTEYPKLLQVPSAWRVAHACTDAVNTAGYVKRYFSYLEKQQFASNCKRIGGGRAGAL